MFGQTNFTHKTTDFYDTSFLNAGEVNFTVAHEFAHLDPDNNALRDTDPSRYFVDHLNNTESWEKDANIRARMFIDMPNIPAMFKCYGYGNRCH